MASLTDSNKTNANDQSQIEVVGASDGTPIGNVGDSFKTTATITAPPDGLKTIEEVHQRIHEGVSYYLQGKNTLGSGAEETILLSTGTKKVHVLVNVFAEKNTNYELWESPSPTAPTGPVNGINRDRNSSNTSDMTKKTYSGISGGTRIVEELISGGSVGQGNNASANHRDEHELILKTNDYYLVKIISNAINNDVNWTINWYEVD